MPVNLLVTAFRHDEIIISWGAPVTPNGEIAFYKLIANKEDVNIKIRDYCLERDVNVRYHIDKDDDKRQTMAVKAASQNKTLAVNGTSLLVKGSQTKADNSKQQCCSCSKQQTQERSKPADVETSIDFEDSLMNIIYIKR